MISIYSTNSDYYENMPIFFSPWWLSATSPTNEHGIIQIKENNQLIGCLPWVLKKRNIGIRQICCPLLTQTLGPWISQPSKGTKYANILTREKKIINNLFDKLPSYDIYAQNFTPEISNWLPLYWRGFKQTTRYTYRLKDLKSLESVWAGFLDKAKTDIRKGTKQKLITEQNNDIDTLLLLNKMTFARQNLLPPYSDRFIKNLFKAALKNNAGTIFVVKDVVGRSHAAVMIVWNRHCAYYLLGGGDPSIRNSGATSIALWEAIKFASTVTNMFDFEGSMIEPIERFVRGFGAIQVPYHSLYHVPSPFLRFLYTIKVSSS